MRVKFPKAKQREFLKKVLVSLACPSLKELSNRLEISYGTLKCYFSEKRLLPQALFIDLTKVSGVREERFELISENWGQVKGGKKSKRRNL